MYSQILIARNETFPSPLNSVSSHQARATTNRILGLLSLLRCWYNPWGITTNHSRGKGSQSLVGRRRKPYLQLSKRSKNSHTRVRIIPRAFQGPVLIAPLGSTIKTWPQDQEDAKGKWLGHGSAHHRTEQLTMPFVFCTQKGSKARHRAPFCLCAKPCWALIPSTICSPTFHSPGRKEQR